MEERNYVALVLREATGLVNERERELKDELAREGSLAGLDGAVERHVKSVLVDIGSVDSLEDVLKHSGLREIPREYWSGASGWQEALTGAAMAAFVHDVRERARDILEGRIPRLDNIQIR